MPTLPHYEQQVAQAHAALIVQVVKTVHDPSLGPELDRLLVTAEQNGWNALVAAIRRLLGGERGESLLRELDDEDGAIMRTILRGLQDPASLPDPGARADATMAAPGLAHMIQQARSGNVQALELLGHMAEQMSRAGGDMARLGGLMRRLVDGERNPDVLCQGMGPQGEQLVNSILEELARLEPH
jgi:hypothetical protein